MKRQVLLIGLLLSLQIGFAQRAADYKRFLDAGRSAVLQGNYQIGKAYFDTAIQVMPYYPAIYQDRGYAYMQLKSYENAIQDFSFVLEKQPYQHEVRALRGEAFYYLGRNEEALDDFEQVVKEDPANSRAIKRVETMRTMVRASATDQQHYDNERRIEEEVRYKAACEREEVIFNTVLPLLFWTAVFATW
jgi:tetratricopeptide (TPR) repeat protein